MILVTKIIQLNEEVAQKRDKITELSRLTEEREANVMELFQRVKIMVLEV